MSAGAAGGASRGAGGPGSTGVGDPTKSTGPLLVVAGSLNLDLVGRAPRIPGPGETVLGSTLMRFHGGKGGNQAVAAARLGARVRFCGAVGHDAAGDELVAGLAAEGIDTAGVVRVEAASGAALITVSEAGENAITVLPGANALVQGPRPSTAAGAGAGGPGGSGEPARAPEGALQGAPEGAPHPASDAALEGARALLLQMEIPRAANQAWAMAARTRQVPVLLNAAPAGADAAALLPWVDLLLVNQGELASLCALTGRAEAALGPATVVTTLGAHGCRVWHRGRALAVPGHAVEVVDTTGAGDTFAGALAWALASGRALADAAAQANVAAALSCRRAGARGGMPTHGELEAALAAA